MYNVYEKTQQLPTEVPFDFINQVILYIAVHRSKPDVDFQHMQPLRVDFDEK